MRLTALSLTRYGNFAEERITFDPAPGRLNILVAPNGAGKSVLRGAFCDLLFGIGGQTPMGFRFGYQGMRLTAEAVRPDGTPFAFGRRKGQGNTLVDGAGAALDQREIASVLGQTDRALLERLFALDTDRLRQGEAELFESNGALADALLSGAGGFRQARKLRQSLEDARDAKAPIRKAAQRPFYQALDRFVDARKRKTAAQLRPEQWQREQTQLDDAEGRRRALNAEADTASAAIARLERIRRVAPFLAAHDAASGWLCAHPEAPRLDSALTTRLTDAQTAVIRAEDRLRIATDRATALDEQAGAVQVDEALLAAGTEIDRLLGSGGAARQAAADLPAVLARLDARRTRVGALLHDLGSALPVAQAHLAVPPRAVVTRARRLIAEHGARRQAALDAPAQVRALDRERAAAAAHLSTLPDAAKPTVLDALVKDIKADGDPVRRHADSEAALADARAELAAALARVPGWTADAAALLALAPLPMTLYERLWQAREAARAAAETQRQLRDTARQARDEALDALAADTGSGPVPDDASLAATRAHREEGWHLIYRLAFTDDLPSRAEAERFAGTLPLPLAYQRAVSAADDLADRRISDAASVERAELGRKAVVAAEARLAAADQRYRLASEALQAEERAWSQVCEALPLGQSPALRDMQAFLAARDHAIEAGKRLAAAFAASEALAARQADWASRLAAVLGQPRQPLAVALRDADTMLATARAAETEHAKATARLALIDKNLVEARARADTAQSALAAWQAGWDDVLRALGRPADEPPDITEEILQIFTELDQQQQEAASLAERVADMRGHNTAFASAVTALAGMQAQEDPFGTLASLADGLRQARAAAQRRSVLATQRHAAAEEAERASQHLAACQTELRTVLALIGAGSADMARSRLALAEERRGREAASTEAETQLLAQGDGQPVAALRAAVHDAAADDLPALIEQARRDRDAASAEAQAAAAEAAALRQRMAQEAADTAVNEAAAAQNAAAATLGRVLEEALVLHTAALLLDRSLAVVEAQDESGLLRRISVLFQTLTNGAYTRVLAEPDESDIPRLTLVPRDFPDERFDVKALSEGTRDQLYLALRLAAIGAHVARAPALPFVADDILQTFDDDRALAALRVLRDVSEETQVIVLTHHRHILDLAAQLPDGAVHVCRFGASGVAAADVTKTVAGLA